MAAKTQPKRERRTLAKPLVQAGVERQPGEEVELRPDQIARLEAQGVVAPQGARKDGAPQGGDSGEGETAT